jgi:hypothetical protein
MNRIRIPIIIIITLFLISGCTDAENISDIYPASDINYGKSEEEFSQICSIFLDYLGVRIADKEFLRNFENVHEIGTYVPGGDDLVLWPIDGYLFDLVFFELYDDLLSSNGDLFITPGYIVFSTIFLDSHEAVLIRNYRQSGVFPYLAISFVDSGNRRHFFGITQNLTQQYCLPFAFVELKLKDGIDTIRPFEFIDVFENYAGIRLLNNERFLDEFEYIHEVLHHPENDEHWDDLLIWAVDGPLMGFELLDFRMISSGDNFYVAPGSVLFSLDVLPPKEALVIRSHSWGGHWGDRAISFLDTDGRRRYLLIQKDFAVGAGIPWWFVEFWIEGEAWPFGVPPWH